MLQLKNYLTPREKQKFSSVSSFFGKMTRQFSSFKLKNKEKFSYEKICSLCEFRRNELRQVEKKLLWPKSLTHQSNN